MRPAPTLRSGSFLLGAYQFLLDHYRRWYEENDPLEHARGKQPALYQGPHGDWRLTSAEKKRILLDHIYGVDIDRQAVEVTKLSLLLKVLEGETDETLGQQLRFWHERALPDLANNVKCGNSLIGPDYFEGRLLPDEEQLRRVNPFDWQLEFPDAMTARGFDAVIGNPPWGGDIDRDLAYYHSSYSAVTREHTDSFKLFIEAGVRLARQTALVAMIVPNTLLRQRRIKDVRALMLQHRILAVVDLGEDVFEGVTAPSCIFVLAKEQPAVDHRVQLLELHELENQIKADLLRTVGKDAAVISQYEFEANADLAFMAPVEVAAAQTVPLGELGILQGKDAGINYQRVSVGMQQKGKSDLAQRLLYEGEQQRPNDRMYWKGSDINRYWMAEKTQRFCRPNYHSFIRSNEVVHLNETVFSTVPKILLRQTADHILATIDYRGIWFGRSVIALVGEQSRYRMEYFLGLLNSRYFESLYDRLVGERARVFAQVKLSKLRQLPIRTIDFTDPTDVVRHDRMVTLVERMLDLHKKLAAATIPADKALYQRQIEATDRQIDALVYELYGLTEKEIAIVEGGSSHRFSKPNVTKILRNDPG